MNQTTIQAVGRDSKSLKNFMFLLELNPLTFSKRKESGRRRLILCTTLIPISSFSVTPKPQACFVGDWLNHSTN